MFRHQMKIIQLKKKKPILVGVCRSPFGYRGFIMCASQNGIIIVLYIRFGISGCVKSTANVAIACEVLVFFFVSVQFSNRPLSGYTDGRLC
jgi:hypothetical protein